MDLKEGQLSRIVINGYKSIKACDLDLRRINVLIGSNGAGKSNFISAFSLLQNVLSKNLQLSAAKSGINSLFYNGRKITDKISFEVYFGKYSYGFSLEPTDDNRLIFSGEFFGYQKYKPVIARGYDESRWDSGVFGFGNIDDPTDDPVFQILKKQNWRVYHFHDTGRDARVKQEHNISNSRSLLFDAGNLAAFLYRLKNHYRESYDEIVSTIRLVAPYFSDFVLEPQESNEEKIVLKWLQADCDDVFNASQLSDGTLRFICLSVLLLQPSNLQPATIIIDEPELGLHPYAISLFAEMVRNLPDDKQIIISTQSVELLNEFDVEDVIVVERKSEGSVFKRLNEDELQCWLDEDYQLGDLWKKNILGGRLSK